MENIKYYKFKSLLKFMIFIFIFCMLFLMFTYILRNKVSADRIYPYFKEEKNSIDILFMGSSRIDEGISPMELWNEFGYTSFNLANGGESIPTNYWKLKIALKTQKPKLVVLDLAYIFQTDKLAHQPERLYQFVDNIPFSIDKVRCICDLTEPEEWLNYLFNIRVYHSRWNSLTENDFKEIKTYNKGGNIAFLESSVELPSELNVLPVNEKTGVDAYDLSLQYIEKIQKLCEENNIELLLVTLPSYATGETNHGDGEALQRIWNGFADYASEHQISYLNMLHCIDEIGIDFSKDYYNWGHPNYLGNKKISFYIGNYIADNYEIVNHKKDDNYLDWDKTYKEYCNWIESMNLSDKR